MRCEKNVENEERKEKIEIIGCKKFEGSSNVIAWKKMAEWIPWCDAKEKRTKFWRERERERETLGKNITINCSNGSTIAKERGKKGMLQEKYTWEEEKENDHDDDEWWRERTRFLFSFRLQNFDHNDWEFLFFLLLPLPTAAKAIFQPASGHAVTTGEKSSNNEKNAWDWRRRAAWLDWTLLWGETGERMGRSRGGLEHSILSPAYTCASWEEKRALVITVFSWTIARRERERESDGREKDVEWENREIPLFKKSFSALRIMMGVKSYFHAPLERNIRVA